MWLGLLKFGFKTGAEIYKNIIKQYLKDQKIEDKENNNGDSITTRCIDTFTNTTN